MDNFREVIYETRFSEQLEQLEPDPLIADECIRTGAEWLLSRDLEMGVNVKGTHVWYVGAIDWPRHREFIVYYTFNDTHIVFLSVTVRTLDIF